MEPGRRLLAALAMILIPSCAVPLTPAELQREELHVLQREFEKIVAAAHADPEVDWKSGWMGNVSVSVDPERRRGLCYQWQELVFAGIEPDVRRLGWEAVRININVGHFNEHHAVVVFDPEEIERDFLLLIDDPPAWVLDAWDSGRAEIFALSEWIDGQVFVFTAPALELSEPEP